MTHIFGLEQVRVPKPDDFFRRTRGPQEMHSHTELLAVIRSAMREEMEEDDMDGNFVPPGPYDNYQFRTLSEYIATQPDDELLSHEINGSECWAWQSTDYWVQPNFGSREKGKGKSGGGSRKGKTTGSASKRRYGK